MFKREGMINLVKVARETYKVIKEEKYTNSNGRTITLDKLITPSVRCSKLYTDKILSDFESHSQKYEMNILVTSESTLQAGFRLRDQNVCVLNFANAIHPGGGWLTGARAQEESIMRASALDASLKNHMGYYKKNAIYNNPLYLDNVIYSPKVPVFRDDITTEWLDEPWLCSVVTAPAPNINPAHSHGFNFTSNDVEEVLRDRIDIILRVMAKEDHKTIILGAWGCGIFCNNPWTVASLFKESLSMHPYFTNVVFAIFDPKDNSTLNIFKRVFQSGE